MTKVFLTAGVAALAIAAPASAGPGGHGGGGHGGGAGQMVRAERVAASGQDRRAMRAAARPVQAERVQMRQQMRAERVAAPQRLARMEARQVRQPDRIARAQARIDKRVARIDNRAVRVENRAARIDNRVNNRAARIDNRAAIAAATTLPAQRLANAQGRGLIAGCPPGLAKRNNGCLPPGQAAKLGVAPLVTPQTASVLRSAQVDALNRRLGYRVAAPAVAASVLGMPLAQASGILPLSPVPQPISYLYPSTPTYDYRYNDGYIYQVDRTSNLIASLIPLLAGGYLPGQTLPQMYMNSAVPDYYGYNSFYPNYQNQCTRYANGVVYYVDCATGLIQNVMPLYDSGYGVGQMLPSSYGYYNVPDQYRPYYYDTADTGYWYAPGAIYQYDPQSSLITSVAALLSPGLTVGQPLPAGYGAYNVPLGFRDTYYDQPNAMYRYSNGYIYQVDPVTQLVTAIVAKALT